MVDKFKWDSGKTISSAINVKDLGAGGHGTTDDTAAINAAIEASILIGGYVIIPPGDYLFTSTILIDDPNVSIIGVGGRYKARLIKGFYGDGIRVEDEFCVIRNIAIVGVLATRDSDTGSGLVLGNDTIPAENIRANYCDIDIYSAYHGVHGVDCQKGDEGYVWGYFNYNGVDGVHCCSEWAGGSADWNANRMSFSAMANGRHGLYVYRAESNEFNAVCQGNTQYGAYIDYIGNYGYIYTEGNVVGGIKFGVNGYGNHFTTRTTSDAYPIYDNNLQIVINHGSVSDSYKLFFLTLSGAVRFTVFVTGTIDANDYTDFVTDNAYGMVSADKNTSIILNPPIVLPQGITYEAACTADDTITVRVHNNTAAGIDVTGDSWYGIAFKAIPL